VCKIWIGIVQLTSKKTFQITCYHRAPRLCGSSLDFEIIRGCMKINKIRPKFHFLTKIEIKVTHLVVFFSYFLSLCLSTFKIFEPRSLVGFVFKTIGLLMCFLTFKWQIFVNNNRDFLIKNAIDLENSFFFFFKSLYYYMRNFCNLIGLEQWYFSLIWNTYMWKLQPFGGSSIKT